MIRKKIFASFTTELTFLQKQEIEKGIRAGLKEAEIRHFASSEFNHLQMQEIRLAFENGLDVKKIKRMCHSSLSYKWMKWMRLEMEKGKKVEDLYLKKQIVMLLIVCLSALFVNLFVPVEQDPYLTLTHSSVQLVVGDPFQPMDYIESYSKTKGTLILPDNVDTSKEGDQIAVYRLMSKDTLIEKILYISVTSDPE